MAITTFILDHHKKRLRTCARLLLRQKGIQLAGELQNEREAIVLIGRLKPHVLVLGLSLSLVSTKRLLLSLRRKSPRTKVILLTGGASQTRVLESLAYGAVGYIDDRVLATFLPKAIRSVHAGEGWIPRKMVGQILDRIMHASSSRRRLSRS